MALVSYTCRQCYKQFSSETGLQRHVNISHKMNEDRKIFSCDQCNRSYMSRQNLNRHKKEDHFGIYKHRCVICQKGFTNLGEYKGHLVTHGAQAQFHCQSCEKSFGFKRLWKAHMLKVHGSCP